MQGIMEGVDPFSAKMKGKLDTTSMVFEKMPESKQFNGNFAASKDENAGNVDKGGTSSGSGIKSWANVVQSTPVTEVKLKYCPLPPGTTVVTPPAEMLQKGAENFKLCIVGTFTKGTMSYTKVQENAKRAWSSRGLMNVSQKDAHNFIFKFNSEEGMNASLARGTWYFDRKPMVVCAWGKTVGISKIESMPIWIKLSNLPDYYWNIDCISHVASVIGPPLYADKLTSQFNPLQFAHICVTYNYGNPLPDSIPVAALDGGAPIVVKVSYPKKPLSCSGCKSLGHSVAACPVTKQKWVLKQHSPATPQPSTLVPATEVPVYVTNCSIPENVDKPARPDIDEHVSNAEQDVWTEVKRRHKSPTPDFDDSSPSPLNTFKGLRNVDEIEKKKTVSQCVASGNSVTNSGHLSKKQRRRLRNVGEGSSHKQQQH